MRLYEIVMEIKKGDLKKIRVYATSNRMARKMVDGLVYTCKEVKLPEIDLNHLSDVLDTAFEPELRDYIMAIVEAGLPAEDEENKKN